ncbi:hypothetical protein D046_8142A, partial [Vibrio parahaemolyticus V-223/04]
MHSLHHL